MKVALDTTVFGQGLNSRSGDVRLFKSFLDRTQAELCIPTVVLEEAANLVRKSIEEANVKLAAAQRLTGDEKRYRKLDVKAGLETYRTSLDALLKHLNARVLPYPSVSHEDLVRKALVPNKPFMSSGKGYQDALIWFSVLELAQSCDEEISFISANWRDWCHSKEELQLHGDLLGDMNIKGIGASRIRLFSSLSDFVQQCTVDTLPLLSSLGEVATRPPDYQQLLIDGKELVETLLVGALPKFLHAFSRADACVEDIEVLGASAPTEIRSSPIRVIDAERRLLQFSAKYKVSLQFLIRRFDSAFWSEQLSFHLQQEWDETRLRVQATTAIRVFFHMIERGENTEDFSVVSISLADSVARLMVNVFDGTRRPISADVDLLITITNGFQEQVHRDFHKGPSVAFTLPFHDNLGDNYTVVASADGYDQAGFTPVKINPRAIQHVDLMLLPKNATFNFRDARWDVLQKTNPDLVTLLAYGAASDAAARDRYTQLMETQMPVLACLLNLTTAMSQISLRAGTPLTYIRELIWDDTMAQDRFFCFADIALIDQILCAKDQFIFKPVPARPHPGAIRRFEQVVFGEANVQLTLHENDTRVIDGVTCFKLEPSIDYFKDPGAHLLLEVLVNSPQGAMVDPRVFYVLRWIAGRHAGVPEFNAPYTLQPLSLR